MSETLALYSLRKYRHLKRMYPPNSTSDTWQIVITSWRRPNSFLATDVGRGVWKNKLPCLIIAALTASWIIVICYRIAPAAVWLTEPCNLDLSTGLVKGRMPWWCALLTSVWNCSHIADNVHWRCSETAQCISSNRWNSVIQSRYSLSLSPLAASLKLQLLSWGASKSRTQGQAASIEFTVWPWLLSSTWNWRFQNVSRTGRLEVRCA